MGEAFLHPTLDHGSDGTKDEALDRRGRYCQNQ